MKNRIEKAIILAAEKHAGQVRRNRKAYIYHPLAVAQILKTAGYGEDYQLAGILHDLLEDTDATTEDIRPFGEKVVKAVNLLTRPDGMDEEEYVNRILEDPVAAVVKSADKIHNLWEMTYEAPFQKAKGAGAERFARRYTEKAAEYYEGKFNAALDRAIDRARACLCCAYTPVWKIPVESPEKMRLYSDIRREEAEKLKEIHDTLTDRPDFTDSRILVFYDERDEMFYAVYDPVGAEVLHPEKQWKLTCAGWIPDIYDFYWDEDFREAFPGELKEYVEEKKKEGFFCDYVTEALC